MNEVVDVGHRGGGLSPDGSSHARCSIGELASGAGSAAAHPLAALGAAERGGGDEADGGGGEGDLGGGVHAAASARTDAADGGRGERDFGGGAPAGPSAADETAVGQHAAVGRASRA
ncbi:MAG: hypothetical protein L0219_19935 [Phycisphaerales bacterium]|nr:hypothetical protein [Phycisphaerales bacterium]MCI0675215.1 hypothetical protein [Phycisphaerales bacterium]